ncbi:MAG: hypothetical protein ACUVT7_07560 [Thermoplasmata archaeon]
MSRCEITPTHAVPMAIRHCLDRAGRPMEVHPLLTAKNNPKKDSEALMERSRWSDSSGARIKP